MLISCDEIFAYVVGLEFMCPKCVTREEAAESSKLSDRLIVSGQIARSAGAGELYYCDRCHKLIVD
jgi:hypothetical protein